MLRTNLYALASFGLGALACFGGSSSSADLEGIADSGLPANLTNPTRDASPAPIGSGISAGGELSILSLVSTSLTMTGGNPSAGESGSVTFIAIVTDTAGLDSIAGGQLMDDAGATYSAFGAGANKGTYTATLDWKTLNSIRVANFDATGNERTFVARFFDNRKNEAKAEVTLKLACRSKVRLDGACGGECVDPTSNAEHCGACGTICASDTLCLNSKCRRFSAVKFDTQGRSPCFAADAFEKRVTCASLSKGAAHPNGPPVKCEGYGLLDYEPDSPTCEQRSSGAGVRSCDQPLRSVGGFVRCTAN